MWALGDVARERAIYRFLSHMIITARAAFEPQDQEFRVTKMLPASITAGRIMIKWWPGAGSNRRPIDFQTIGPDRCC